MQLCGQMDGHDKMNNCF